MADWDIWERQQMCGFNGIHKDLAGPLKCEVRAFSRLSRYSDWQLQFIATKECSYCGLSVILQRKTLGFYHGNAKQLQQLALDIGLRIRFNSWKLDQYWKKRD